MANKTLFGEEARDALLVGIKTVHDATAMSIGARGRNAIFRQFGRPKITNDGVRIARTVDPEEEFAKLGADLMKEAADRTDAEAGDGTTTSTVLAYALIQEGLDAIKAGANPMQLRLEMDEAVQHVVKELEKRAQKIEGIKDLERVAVVSVENEELGALIAGAAMRAGIDGDVLVEEDDRPEFKRQDVDGYRFDRGLASPYLVTNPEKMEAIIEACPVLVTDKSWNLNSDLVPLIEDLHKQGFKNLLVIANEISGELLATLVKNSLNQVFRTVVVNKPYNEEMLEDIATLTGATAMTKTKGIVKPEFAYLGTAMKVVADQNHTTIIGGKGNKKDIEQRIKDLKERVAATDGYEKEKAKQRIARLTGGISIISIGAPTPSERNYIKLKADDAVNACRAALDGGIVPGGGAALYDIAEDLWEESDVMTGKRVVKNAIKKPMKLIVASGDGDILKVPKGGGFNVKTLAYEKDMVKAGITDPVKVTRSALVNAASLAGIFLTTEAAIVDLPPKEDEKRHS